jgi:hypothetical protein
MINSSETRSRISKAPATNVFGRYRLIANVGRGGMADVYLAVTESPEARAQFQKLLVIKMLKRELCEDADFVRMFLDEARLAARLNHPNVVQTIEVCEAGGRYFLAMEFLDCIASCATRRHGPNSTSACACISWVRRYRVFSTHTNAEITTARGSTSCTETSRRRIFS